MQWATPDCSKAGATIQTWPEEPASAAAMPDSGGIVAFANARFAIDPGARFGVALTVIRAEDGLASPVAFFDVIRT